MYIFIAGPRAVKTLNKEVKERLNNIINNNFTIVVGDANGIDKQIQMYCHSMNYKNVQVFASNGKARNNIGQWEVKRVDVSPSVTGFDFYAAKDLEMAKKADYGFMIWNGKSKGTLNNIVNLIKMEKKVLVYLTTVKNFYTVNTFEEIEMLGSKEDSGLKNHLKNDSMKKNNEQMALFKI